MVCWAKPNADTNPSEKRLRALANIKELETNEIFMESLGALEKTMKTSLGSLPCLDGAIYKTPNLKVVAVEGDKENASMPPAKRHKTTAAGTVETKGKGKSPASVPAVNLSSFPPSPNQLSDLKKAAKTESVASTSSDSTSASTSKLQRVNEGKVFIDGEKISFVNEQEWLEKGLKTPKTKILKSLVDDCIDSKTVAINLARMQLVGDGGSEWQTEEPSEHHLATMFVILPVKHKGGKITVRHGEETWSIDAGKRKSTERCSWIAFASDAEFQIDSVTDGTQVLLVYHVVGEAKRTPKTKTADEDNAVVSKLDQLAQNLGTTAPKRVGVFLSNKYNPKDFSASCLKGRDRWLYNVLKDSRYEVKLTFVRVLLCSWGFYDEKDFPGAEKRVQMHDCGEDWLESEIWEMDLAKLEEWGKYQKSESYKCRRLPWEMPWLHTSLVGAIRQMTRVDRDARPSWSEGLTLAETYRAAAFLISVKPRDDADDGPFTHFYPVAHPEPRGVSEREDFEWSRSNTFLVSVGTTESELDEMSRKYNESKDWVHDDLD